MTDDNNDYSIRPLQKGIWTEFIYVHQFNKFFSYNYTSDYQKFPRGDWPENYVIILDIHQ